MNKEYKLYSIILVSSIIKIKEIGGKNYDEREKFNGSWC